MVKKKIVSLMLSEDTIELLDLISKKTGVSKSIIVENIICESSDISNFRILNAIEVAKLGLIL